MAKNTNENSTRYYSDAHEKSVCKALGATQTPNSGAGKWKKGDCVQKSASLLIECKTSMSVKDSVSINREWIEKNKMEAWENRLSNHCICFNFGEGTPNYYVIDENTMKYLVGKLAEENS